MPSIAPLPLPKWARPSKTNETLDWAEIKVIDLSRFDEPGEKYKLAEDLRGAVCDDRPGCLGFIADSILGPQNWFLQRHRYWIYPKGGRAPV